MIDRPGSGGRGSARRLLDQHQDQMREWLDGDGLTVVKVHNLSSCLADAGRRDDAERARSEVEERITREDGPSSKSVSGSTWSLGFH